MLGRETLVTIRVGSVTSTCVRSSFGARSVFPGPMPPAAILGLSTGGRSAGAGHEKGPKRTRRLPTSRRLPAGRAAWARKQRGKSTDGAGAVARQTEAPRPPWVRGEDRHDATGDPAA